MQNSKAAADKKQKLKGCSALCCSCRLSVSSSSEEAESSNSDRYPTISSLTHSMVQERLDKMIREREEAKNEERGRRRMRRAEREEKTKFIVMIAMEKSSYDPREDFRESIEQMIMANRIHDTKDLRRLLNYYVSMNAEEYRGIILEVFHEVCTSFFLSCKRPLYEQNIFSKSDNHVELNAMSLGHGLSELQRLQELWRSRLMCLHEAGRYHKVALLDLYLEALDPELYNSRLSNHDRDSAKDESLLSNNDKLFGLQKAEVTNQVIATSCEAISVA
ncbi:hypothetical protein K7X08_020701 [Anisodus acutangulus]|uniref:Transcription repressor n=1 Tax=Anisodus acutangulus TaxID=402998 RepID=A0A9Q1MTZ4_9SOLA|nr:hypothetical protein K7X08_020701 [Anisodus acutangulus]